jgi:hypothetical protein
MSTVPMLQSVSFEPLLHQAKDEEEEEEGEGLEKSVFCFYKRISFVIFSLGHTDDDRFVETSIQIRQAQGTFPPAFDAAVYLLVDMLEDEDTLVKGTTDLLEKKISLLNCFFL